MKDTINCPHCGEKTPAYEKWCVICDKSTILPADTQRELLQRAHVIKPFEGLIPHKIEVKK